MADYNVQIISCVVKTELTEEEFKKEVLDRLPLRDSAYHATAPVIQVNRYCSYADRLTLSMITQARFNVGVAEFKEWIRPMIVQGIGEDETWGINFSEHSGSPQLDSIGEENYQA